MAGDLSQAIAASLASGRDYHEPGEAAGIVALIGEAGDALDLRDIEYRLWELEEQQARKRW